MLIAGKAWPVFALRESRLWADRYNRYFADDKPTMIIAYDELANPDTVQRQLLKITNFLQVPIRQSALMCTADAAQWLPLKPPLLRRAFDPYLLLSVGDLPRLNLMANLTELAISRAREQYRPRVWYPAFLRVCVSLLKFCSLSFVHICLKKYYLIYYVLDNWVMLEILIVFWVLVRLWLLSKQKFFCCAVVLFLFGFVLFAFCSLPCCTGLISHELRSCKMHLYLWVLLLLPDSQKF